MEIFILLGAALAGLICYKMAESRGRDPWFGAFLGFCFGLFAIIGYAIAGNKKVSVSASNAVSTSVSNKKEAEHN